jgi:solute carrier family 25 protein 39/40
LSLWRGLGSTIARDAPFSAIYWFSIETIKSRISSRWPIDTYPKELASSFISGSTSGIIAAIATHPFDVIKTIQQVAPAPVPRIRDVASSIYKSQGFYGYWLGLIPRITKSAPACGIMISTYELGKRYFNDLGI